eukprot:6924-Heterococcus_DN1.PRE.8
MQYTSSILHTAVQPAACLRTLVYASRCDVFNYSASTVATAAANSTVTAATSSSTAHAMTAS